MTELRVNTCALRAGAQAVQGLAGSVEHATAGLDGAAPGGLAPLATAVAEAPLAAALERLHDVLQSLGWGLELLSAGLEQSAGWYEAAEAHAAERARATGVPQRPVYGPPPVGPVDDLRSLQP